MHGIGQGGRPRRRLAATVAVALAAAGPASADSVRVEVDGLRSDRGLLRAAVCSESEFLGPRCAHSGAVPAARHALTIDGVPPGDYAVQVFHDEDGDGDLDRGLLRPLEGMGFSRDAAMRFGPPNFADAAFALDGAARVHLTIRYFQ